MCAKAAPQMTIVPPAGPIIDGYFILSVSEFVATYLFGADHVCTLTC